MLRIAPTSLHSGAALKGDDYGLKASITAKLGGVKIHPKRGFGKGRLRPVFETLY